jgi:hypothetical protein
MGLQIEFAYGKLMIGVRSWRGLVREVRNTSFPTCLDTICVRWDWALPWLTKTPLATMAEIDNAICGRRDLQSPGRA